MSERTFEMLTRDDLEAMNDCHWFGALRAVLGAETADLPEDGPVSLVLPYRRADEAFTAHLEACTTCQGASWWDGCPEGNQLATLTADAVAAQHDLAGQN